MEMILAETTAIAVYKIPYFAPIYNDDTIINIHNRRRKKLSLTASIGTIKKCSAYFGELQLRASMTENF